MNNKTETNSAENRKRAAGIKIFLKKIFSSGYLRFAGWWSIFAGALAVNSVCPVCGSTSCPVGIGTTGIIAGLLAAIKLWGSRIVALFKKKKEKHDNQACSDITQHNRAATLHQRTKNKSA